MQIGEIIRVEIERLTGTLDGVGKINGLTAFVRGGLPGEIVRAQVTYVAKRYLSARLFDVISPSPIRREPLCPEYSCCGGCSGLHMPYETALAAKAMGVKDAFARIGGIDIETPPMFGMEHPFHYRNKTIFQVNAKEIGFFDERRRVINLEKCYIQSQSANRVLHALQEAHVSDIKRVMVRENRAGLCVVALSTETSRAQGLDKIVDALRNVLPNIQGIAHNVNKNQAGEAFAGEFSTAWGDTTLTDRILDLNFRVSPQAFFQVNAAQTDILYAHALHFADVRPTDTVIDAYCGAGTITLHIAKSARNVIGVETHAAAIASARENARMNNIHNVTFIEGAAEAHLPMLIAQKRPATVVVDPPRAGCDKILIEALCAYRVPRIVYISCDPATLARDLKLLSAAYAIESVQLVDMFCHTGHVESVVLLEQK